MLVLYFCGSRLFSIAVESNAGRLIREIDGLIFSDILTAKLSLNARRE
ncbi:MAG: hypothetical protein QW303_03495 [Nitrososphaerota archaeon]